MLTRAQIQAISDSERLLADAQANIRAVIFGLRGHGLGLQFFSTEQISELRASLAELLRADCAERLAQHASPAELRGIAAAA